MEWKPIETAPKCGREIIVAKSGKMFFADWSPVNGWTTRNGNPIHPSIWYDIPEPKEAE